MPSGALLVGRAVDLVNIVNVVNQQSHLHDRWQHFTTGVYSSCSCTICCHVLYHFNYMMVLLLIMMGLCMYT